VEGSSKAIQLQGNFPQLILNDNIGKVKRLKEKAAEQRVKGKKND
jgi:hypothetical protein